MQKMTLKDIDLEGKTVLHHCDFNIKLKKNRRGEIVPRSDVRLKAYFPSIFYLLEKKCKIVFISYLERPGGKRVPELSTKPVAKRLSQLINREVKHVDELVGEKVKNHIAAMKPGDMVMLENTRFYPGELSDDDELAKQIAENGDLMVMDAFGHAHRIHASVTGVARHIPSVMGLYTLGEIETFDKLKENPQKPLVLIVGGTKTHDKIKAIRNLMPLTDYVLTGGAVANNFLKARGVDVQDSFLEEPFVDKAKKKKISPVDEARKLLEEYPDKILVPEDMVASTDIENPGKKKRVDFGKGEKIPEGWTFLDIGRKTIKRYSEIIKKAETVFWDGPMGKYEDPRFRKGTLKIADMVAENGKTTILAGGDTAALAEDFGLVFLYDHVSIAGGATLEYLAGEPMPGLEVIADKK